MDGIETGRHFLDILHTDGLVKHACPPCLKGMRHHLIISADGRRSEKERIFAMDAAKIDGKTGCHTISKGAIAHLSGKLTDANGTIVVDASLFGPFQFFICTVT